jgi:ankyrin repeat protein
MAINDEFDDKFSMLLLSGVHCGAVISLKNDLSTVTNPNTCLNRVYEEPEEQKCTLLMLACLNEYTDMVYMLLNSFQPDTEILNHIKISVKDQNVKMYENVTVLWAAAAINNFEIVKLLVEYGARINHTTKTNSTALRCACFYGNVTMARYLIEHGADKCITKDHNETNLMLAVFREHIELVGYLVDELECDVNECDDEGRSPLYLAVERESLELVEFLLKRGARNFSASHDPMSPLMLAAEKRRNDLVNLIFPFCTSLEQIQAEELLGSAFACREHGVCDLEKSFEHFSRALDLRTIHQLSKSVKESTHEIFNHRQECQTIDQLKELQSNSNPDNMYIEALLVRERLLGPSNVKYRNSLLHRGATLANTAQYQHGIAFWMYELELHQQWSIPVFSKQLRYFVKTFAIIVHKWSFIPVQNLCKVMSLIIEELEHDTKEFDYNLLNLLCLITITSQVQYLF